jgi:hypothetical protein
MTEPDALAAALLQLSAHAGQLAELSALGAALRTTQEGQAEILAGLVARLDELAPADEGDPVAYTPGNTPQFWRLPDGPEREAAVARLRAWVEQIYRPGYGHLAASLGACWDQHPLCLYTLDWLSELWSVLYLQPRRTAGTLAGQAEWQIRLLAAAAELMKRETSRCQHANDRRARSLSAMPGRD